MACRQCRSLLAWVPGLRAYSTAAVGPLGLASAQVQDPAHARRLAAVQGMKVEHALSADEASTSELEVRGWVACTQWAFAETGGAVVWPRVWCTPEGAPGGQTQQCQISSQG